MVSTYNRLFCQYLNFNDTKRQLSPCPFHLNGSRKRETEREERIGFILGRKSNTRAKSRFRRIGTITAKERCYVFSFSPFFRRN